MTLFLKHEGSVEHLGVLLQFCILECLFIGEDNNSKWFLIKNKVGSIAYSCFYYLCFIVFYDLLSKI